jgi:cyclophilin family peptidyl-prolyl cis-trans isomerase/HEAT repeat protein
MRKNFYFLFSVILTLVSIDICAQNFSPDVRKVLELQDMRTFGDNDELGKYLLSTDPGVRVRAIYALGNIGDSNSVSKLNFLLAGPFEDYPNEEDMRAAAFALGQIPCDESKKFIRLVMEDNSKFGESSKKYFIDALGRIGDSTDLITVSSFANSQDTGITRAVAMSVARFGLRRIKSPAAIEALKNFSNNSKDLQTLRNTAFAFWRAGDKALLSNAQREVYSLAESEDAQTRMWGFNALGRFADKKLLMYMLESFLSESDWRVRVNMINMFANINADSLLDMRKQINTVLWIAFNDKNENVSLNAISVAAGFFPTLTSAAGAKWKDEAADLMIGVMNDPDRFSPGMLGAAAVALSQIKKDQSKSELFKLFRSTSDYNVKAEVLRAFGNFDNAMVYKEVRDTVTADVTRYNELHPNTDGRMIASDDLAKLYAGFTEMVSSLDNRLDAKNQLTGRLMLLEFAGSKDPLITAISLDGLQDSIYLSERSEIVSVLKFDFSELKYPDDLLVQLIFIDAFKNLGDKSAVPSLTPLLASENYDLAKASADALETLTGDKQEFTAKKKYDFDWEFIEESANLKELTLKTTKGDIRLELFTTVAPFTVQSFIKLAQKDFFDSTKFHRVVPNFVIQGGDPTSTGYGGPDYSQRSENSPLTYETGILGMASSGKDTEGSQFFITHSATPHLDGRYTIFGRVIEGMDAVDKIQIGDVIYDVAIAR